MVEEWRNERRANLLKIMVAAGASPVEDPPTERDAGRLTLATTMFFCTMPWNTRSPSSQRALCLTCVGGHTGNHECRRQDQSWSTTCLKYDIDAEEMTRQLVIAVGLSLETTTAADMNALDARFYCEGCPKWDKLARS